MYFKRLEGERQAQEVIARRALRKCDESACPITQIGGYVKEARHTFSDKKKQNGYDVVEADGQGRGPIREGRIVFYNIGEKKIRVRFSAKPNSQETSGAYHKNPPKYYEALAKKIEAHINENPEKNEFAFSCPLGTEAEASIENVTDRHKATHKKRKR